MKINWTVRLHNPVFWAQAIGGVLLTALSYSSMSPEVLTSWGGVVDLLRDIVRNPYLLWLCIWTIWSSINDPTTNGLGDSALALTYRAPKIDPPKGAK